MNIEDSIVKFNQSDSPNRAEDFKIKIRESTDKKNVLINGVITFKIYIENISDNTLYDLSLFNSISDMLEINRDSIEINGNKYKVDTVNPDIYIGKIESYSVKIIKFKVKVVKECKTEIECKSILKYRTSEENHNIRIIESNIVNIKIERASICVRIKADRKSVSTYDVLHYEITIINDGSLDTVDVTLYSNFSKEYLKIVDGTFSVNGKIINSVDVIQGVYIGVIPSNTCVVVKYDAQVLISYGVKEIVNKAYAEFSYKADNKKYLKKCTTLESFGVSKVLFNVVPTKEIIIEDNFFLPYGKADINYINKITAEIEDISGYVINTIKGRSNENQYLSGYKYIVYGIIKYTVEYTSNSNEHCMNAVNYYEPFSSYIVLPDDFKVGSAIKVNGTIENIYYKKSDLRSIFKSVSVLLYSKINSCSN